MLANCFSKLAASIIMTDIMTVLEDSGYDWKNNDSLGDVGKESLLV